MAAKKSSRNSSPRKKERIVDAGRAESEKFEPDPEVAEEFTEAQRLGGSGGRQMIAERLEHHSKSPILTGGDVDADWAEDDVGEESVGGENPTPDQDVVDELGRAVGITYQDDEPLGTEDKLNRRDRDRWELDPASSEGFRRRSRQEGEFEEE